jgi:hypothetical protein
MGRTQLRRPVGVAKLPSDFDPLIYESEILPFEISTIAIRLNVLVGLQTKLFTLQAKMRRVQILGRISRLTTPEFFRQINIIDDFLAKFSSEEGRSSLVFGRRGMSAPRPLDWSPLRRPSPSDPVVDPLCCWFHPHRDHQKTLVSTLNSPEPRSNHFFVGSFTHDTQFTLNDRQKPSYQKTKERSHLGLMWNLLVSRSLPARRKR